MHRHRTVGALFLTLLSAACTPDKKTEPSAESGASAGTTTAGDVAVAAPGQCTVDYASTKCKNVLPANWNALSETEQYETLSKDITWNMSDSRGVKRQFRAGCMRGQPDQVLRAAQASLYMESDPRRWQTGVIVAMTKVVPQGNGECPDDIYGVAKAKDREFYLLFTVEAPTTTATRDTRIGTWTIYSYNSKTPTGSRTIVSSGTYIRCENDHEVTAIRAIAEFQTCAVKHALLKVAKEYGLTAEQVLASYDSLRTRDSASAKAFTGEPALVTALRKILATDNPAGDPAWTTCTLGCCVAEPPGSKVALGRAPYLRRESTRQLPDTYAFAIAGG